MASFKNTRKMIGIVSAEKLLTDKESCFCIMLISQLNLDLKEER